MAQPTVPLAEWRDVAVQLAQRAGSELLQHVRGAPLRAESKGRRRELVTAADRAAERVVVGGLLERFPDHAVLAEEGVLTAQGRASRASDFTWLVDPLDGTTNFVHRLPFFAVAIALAVKDEPVLGVVHAPVLGETFVAAQGLGATRNGEPLRVSATDELDDALLATGFSYNRNEPGRDDNAARLARALPQCRDLRRLGSAELDLCLVAAGTYDGYWEMYLQPYDLAAGAVIVREAGGTVTDLDGGQDWLSTGHVLATNGRLHEPLRALVGGGPAQTGGADGGG